MARSTNPRSIEQLIINIALSLQNTFVNPHTQRIQQKNSDATILWGQRIEGIISKNSNDFSKKLMHVAPQDCYP